MADKIILTCPFCNNQFQMSHSVFDGKSLPRYGLTVCDICFFENQDGWAARHEGVLLAALEEHGLSVPERNANGLLPCS